MANPLRPSRYESVHAVSVIAPSQGDDFAREMRERTQLDKLQSRHGVTIQCNPRHEDTLTVWAARLECSNLFECFGLTPEGAKTGLVVALRKIADELEQAKVL